MAGLSILAGGLGAERNGVFISAGFQYSLVKTTITGAYGVPSDLDIHAGQSNMYGVALRAGYKYFFGRGERRNGVRAYAFYNYGYSSPTFNGLQLNSNVYGVGTDYLFDFLDRVKIQAGFFIGIGFAGSSWSTNKASMFKSLLVYPNTETNFSYFQIPLQWGLRINASKRHGWEMGIKIPILHNYYFKDIINKQVNGLTFQRSLVFYTHYIYNF